MVSLVIINNIMLKVAFESFVIVKDENGVRSGFCMLGGELMSPPTMHRLLYTIGLSGFLVDSQRD